MLIWRRKRWPLIVTIALMPVALAAVALNSPGYLAAAFNPVTLNLGMIALAVIAYLLSSDLPSASSCLREPPEHKL